MKNIKWLKEEIPNLRGYAVIIDGEDGEWEPVTTVSMEDIYELIDQLEELEVKRLDRKMKELESYNDELIRDNNQLRNELDNQEVLSEEWIERNTSPVDDEGRLYVWKSDLQNAIVQKQELPVIPKFVANWIEETKKQYKTLIFAFTHIYAENEIGESPSKEEKRLYQWLESADNEETFARAWLDGFMVETEQKYYVMNNDDRMMLVRMMDGKTITEADPFKLEDMYEGEKESHRLTEQEIKGYDPRYWAFRKPVEEVE